MTTLASFKARLWNQDFNLSLQEAGRYPDGTPCLMLISDEGEPFGKLTVAMPEAGKEILEPGEYLIKTWSENEVLIPLVREFFVDTGKRLSNAYVEAEIWRLK
jgi:hypothetical protein